MDGFYNPGGISNSEHRTIRLLFAATVPVTLSRFLQPISAHFRARGWGVDAMAKGVSGCAECLDAFDHVWDVSWSRNPIDLNNLLVAAPQIREIVTRERFDLVHVHTPVAAFVARYALQSLRKKIGVKVIYTAHGFHFYQGGAPIQNAVFLGLEKLAGRWTDRLVVINCEDQEAVRRYNIVAPNRVCYMPGIGVDTELFSPEAVSPAAVQDIRQELGLKPEDKLFLMVANFDPRKRHRDAIRAFAELDCPDAHLAFVGSGALMSRMRALADETRVRKRIHFLGWRRDIPALMRASLAVLLPSMQEGLSRSVMEALSLETPVIGTDIRGIRDLVNETCGLLVPMGNVEALASAIAWITGHPHEAQAMGRRGRERMAAFDLRHILALHEALYFDVLSGDSPPN